MELGILVWSLLYNSRTDFCPLTGYVFCESKRHAWTECDVVRNFLNWLLHASEWDLPVNEQTMKWDLLTGAVQIKVSSLRDHGRFGCQWSSPDKPRPVYHHTGYKMFLAAMFQLTLKWYMRLITITAWLAFCRIVPRSSTKKLVLSLTPSFF